MIAHQAEWIYLLKTFFNLVIGSPFLFRKKHGRSSLRVLGTSLGRLEGPFCPGKAFAYLRRPTSIHQRRKCAGAEPNDLYLTF